MKRLLRILFVLLLLCVALFWLFRARYSQPARELACTRVKNATSDMMNRAVDAQIKEGSLTYDRLVYFEKDLDGKITALKTNMGQINLLKAAVLERINRDMADFDDRELGIPLGSLLLPEAFSGKGALLPVKMLAVRNSDASVTGAFRDAGINQTIHQLVLDVSIDVSVLVLGKVEAFPVSTQIVVAETVIVGQVPQMYLQSGG